MSKIVVVFSWVLIASQITLACGSNTQSGADGGVTRDAPAAPGEDGAVPEHPDGAVSAYPDDLVEDRTVYDQDDLLVHTIRLSVSDLDGLEAVHDDVPGAEVAAVFEADEPDAGGVQLAAGLRLRGATSRDAAQKSYRIELLGTSGLWRGHRVINLNKHPYDLSRVRQKLSFDYFEQIPHFTSLRTGFVRLFINGEDMGLFTQVERPGARFLATHGLDPQGQLYKAEDFLFEEIAESAWSDPAALESFFEVKANPDHAKLREMLAAVNDEDRDIDEVIDTYFYRDNYLTWWAINILMGNLDTLEQNFFLYSPAASKRWYFLPWDYDDSWGSFEQPDEAPRGRHEIGIGNWWFGVLHQRFIQKPGNIDALSQMVNRLATETITPARTAEMLAKYHDIVRARVEVSPDLDYLPVGNVVTGEQALAVFEDEHDRIPGMLERLRADFITSLDWPMPVWIEEDFAFDGSAATFVWSESFDLQGDGITYDFQIATTPTFEPGTVVAERAGLSSLEITLEIVPGEYYARVIARDDADPENHWQQCSNTLFDEDGSALHKGVARLIVR